MSDTFAFKKSSKYRNYLSFARCKCQTPPFPKTTLLKQIYLLILFFVSGSLFAQNLDYENVIPAETTKPRSFEAYLVQLAWLNTPENRVVEAEKEVATLERKKEKFNWFEQAGASMNVNPTNNVTVVGETEYFLPGINYGVSLNIGGLLTGGLDRKIADQNIKIADANINQQKLLIRSQVSKAYQKYKLANQILKSRYDAEEDLAAAYTIVSELFKKNRAEVDDYTSASSAYFAAVEQRQAAEADIEFAIIEMEELIGVEWEIASRMEKVYGE